MSSEALEKTVITDYWQIFLKKLVSTLFTIKRFQFKIIWLSRALDKKYTPVVHCTPGTLPPPPVLIELRMLCLLVYFLDHLWMTSILFDVNMYCRCLSISKLVNWVISDPLVHKDLIFTRYSHTCRLHYMFSFVKK